jgi:dihydroorotase
MGILIKNGRVIDPANGVDAVKDIFVCDGKISVACDVAEEIDAAGCWVVPGLVDMHVHLRDPGQQHKETIETGTKAAAAGGFTTVCCMPNTSPVVHSAEVVEYINSQSGKIRVFTVGSITVGLLGEELSDISGMKKAGICAISDDGKTVENAKLFTEAMYIAKKLDLPILSHCEPEEEIIERDIKLAKEAGVALHICHVSTARGVEMIRAAQESGQAVTAEAAPHHFALTADDHQRDPNFKMAPPLRSEADRQAIISALQDGTISVIATDHAPHHESEKSDFDTAMNGVVGLETAVSVAITTLSGVLSPSQIIAAMTTNPAKILRLPVGTLSIGAAADITIINPEVSYKINKHLFKGKSRNTPFDDLVVSGKVTHTIFEGRIIYAD